MILVVRSDDRGLYVCDSKTGNRVENVRHISVEDDCKVVTTHLTFAEIRPIKATVE